jgi:hypothetical protein
MSDVERQATIDGEHLRILSICYLVYAGVNVFFSLFGLLYAFMGLFVTELISRVPPQPNQPPPPEFVGLFFGVFGFGMFALMMVLAVLKFIVAKRLKQRRSRTLCMVVAALSCFGIPFGTVLGVFTFVVLSRPSVAKMFDTQASTLGGHDGAGQ